MIRSDRVPEELWMEVCNIVQEAVIKAIPKKKKCKRAKWLSEEALQIAEKRREAKGKGDIFIYYFSKFCTFIITYFKILWHPFICLFWVSMLIL